MKWLMGHSEMYIVVIDKEKGMMVGVVMG